jgi:hypothetical protein
MSGMQDHAQRRRESGVTEENLLACGSLPGEPPPQELLDKFIAGWDLDELLRRLTALSLDIADARDLGNDDAAYQVKLATRLNDGLPPPSLVMGSIASGKVTAITSTGRIADLMLYASGVRPHGVVLRCSMLRLLTLFNYCSLSGPDGRYSLDPNSVEAAFAVSTSHVDRFLNVTHRYREFVKWADKHEGANGIRLRESIMRSTGLSYDDWARCIVALNGFYVSHDSGASGGRALEKARITDAGAPLRTWLQRRTLTAEQVAKTTRGPGFEHLRSRGFYEAYSRPVLDVGDRCYLVNPRGLDNALGVGVFFAALDGGNNPQDFFAFAGHFFEEYAVGIVRRLVERSDSPCHGEVTDVHGDMSSDFFVLEGRNLVFFEMRFGRVARPVIERLESARIRRGVREHHLREDPEAGPQPEALRSGRIVGPRSRWRAGLAVVSDHRASRPVPALASHSGQDRRVRARQQPVADATWRLRRSSDRDNRGGNAGGFGGARRVLRVQRTDRREGGQPDHSLHVLQELYAGEKGADVSTPPRLPRGNGGVAQGSAEKRRRMDTLGEVPPAISLIIPAKNPAKLMEPA